MIGFALKTANVHHRKPVRVLERAEKDVFSQEECIHFLNNLEGERFGLLFSFALATGMRPEEYFALQWKDLDLEKGTATVRRALVTHRKGGGWHFSEPKTAKSRRTLPLPSSIVKRTSLTQEKTR